MVASGNKICDTIDKEDDTYTTAALELVLLNSKIDSDEGRCVVIIDISTALIQKIIEDEEDKVILFMLGKLYELLTTTTP